MEIPSNSTPGPRASWSHRVGRWLRNLLIGTGALAVLLVLLCVGLIEGKVARGDYPTILQDLGWMLGEQEHIYNFGSVTSGKVFRSGQPDDRFIDYVVKNYGVRHIVTLNGESPLEEQEARALGITVDAYDWDEDNLPTREEFQQVVRMLADDTPVLVHCRAGKDRTGYLVAAYRVLELGWPMEKALNEMRIYGHMPERYPAALAYFMKLVAPKS